MKTKWHWIILFATVLISAGPAWAAEKGYCYIVAYSMQKKEAYHSPVFMQKVGGASYSAEEFCADVELIQKMEAAFQKFMQQSLKLNPADYTVSARSAYKSQAIAQRRLDNELKEFNGKGLAVQTAGGFRFQD